MIHTLADLADAAGRPGVFLIAQDVHTSTLAALARRELISINKITDAGRVVRQVALTDAGFTFCRRALPIVSNALVSSDTMPKKRQRCTLPVQLDTNRAGHADALEYAQNLKRRRRFLPVVVDSLTLHADLANGSTAALSRLFPGVVEKLKAELKADMLHDLFRQHVAAGAMPALADAAKMARQTR
jgi:hypothetical protein